MSRIEDYALLGDLHSAALVGRDGSIDWMCLPSFDSPACFAALLDTPDAVWLHSDVTQRGQDWSTVSEFTVRAGDRLRFVLSWAASHERAPAVLDAEVALLDTVAFWEAWVARGHLPHRFRGPVCRSLITLKALTYLPTGGIVAAATTSLPEQIGGPRNWDYRYCWLRDATLTLQALLAAGYRDEARAWREWLLRAVAGNPADLQIMYGLDGRRRLPEAELDWLSGYEGSAPVRTGNAAAGQFQLDVWGEVLDGLLACSFWLVDTLHGAGRETHATALFERLLDLLMTLAFSPRNGTPPHADSSATPRRHSATSRWSSAPSSLTNAEPTAVTNPSVTPSPVSSWRPFGRQLGDHPLGTLVAGNMKESRLGSLGEQQSGCLQPRPQPCRGRSLVTASGRQGAGP